MWMLDTDYDGRSLFPRQVFFPMAGEKDGWARLAKNLKAAIDEELIEAYRGNVSLPYIPATCRYAIEDADPALIPVAIKNWPGLMPEERWWLYTMTNAATGHAVQGRNKGWRKAVRYALTENPVSYYTPAHRLELFRNFDIATEKSFSKPASRRKKRTLKNSNNGLKPKLLW